MARLSDGSNPNWFQQARHLSLESTLKFLRFFSTFLNRLEFLPVAPFNLLAAPAPAASQSAANLQMCSVYAQIRTFFQSRASF